VYDGSIHKVAGFWTFMLVVVLGIGGVAAISTRQFCKYRWHSSRVLTLGAIHKYLAYFVILASQFSIITGFLLYSKSWFNPDFKNLHVMLGTMNTLGFFAILITLEIWHRLFLAREIVFKIPDNVITKK
jgi:hypothetical protein